MSTAMNRREFLKTAAMTGSALAAPRRWVDRPGRPPRRAP